MAGPTEHGDLTWQEPQEGQLLVNITLGSDIKRPSSGEVISAPGSDMGLLPDLDTSVFHPFSNGSNILSAPFYLYISIFFGGRVGSGMCFLGFAVISQIRWVWSQCLPCWQTANAPSAQRGSWLCLGFVKPISYYRHVSAITTSLINISQIQQLYLFSYFRPLSK